MLVKSNNLLFYLTSLFVRSWNIFAHTHIHEFNVDFVSKAFSCDENKYVHQKLKFQIVGPNATHVKL